ncbi:MAG: phosphoribosyltransferase domain-containing protein [Pseudomonas sp.]|nr:phosphoribosyltransferase domain-containing protein [Pseudomonas sp.]MDX1367437.1 phosphoribosyltransferase domain-containing protein [Pseudomonas sp.]
MNASPNHSQEMSAELMRGRLCVKVAQSAASPESLFGFAERRNPKRAFLFVSKVLGRHIPVAPALMQASFAELAAKIPADLPGPVLVIGMAETAVGLGAGVHRCFAETRPDTMYLVSTRHPVGTELFARFEEEHSHASAHLIHLPTDPVTRDMMLTARSLVLVDDEASTGKTFINLLASLTAAGLDHIERVVTVTLTDWSEGAVARQIGSHADSVSLLEGSYAFDENPDAPLPEMPEVGIVAAGDWPLVVKKDWGRLGVREHLDTLAPGLQVAPGERILVVGTGEYVWRPFLLAERLEKQGAQVHFGSTTRSPIALGHAIGHALVFADNYGLGIPNFIYNVAPGQYDRVLICCETPVQSIDPRLVEALQAKVISDAD